jgi:hypothetical protein
MRLAPIRRRVWITAGYGALVLASCDKSTPAIAEPVEGIPLAQQRTIDRNELGYKWPFDAGTGTIACDGGALFFRTGGTTYALSRGAGTRGYAGIDAIRRTQGSGPPSDPPASVADCKARLRTRSNLSETELTRVEAEGAERYWPPLKPPLMSLDALTDAAKQLCPH